MLPSRSDTFPQEGGYHIPHSPPEPTLTKEQKRKRVELCQELATWTPAQLEAIVWTDEKKFTCGGSRKITYLCRRSDPPKEHAGEREKWLGGDGIMVWMGVSIKLGFFFHEFPNKDQQGNKISVNGHLFKKTMLQRNGFLSFLRRHRGAVVAMDNCPIHNSTRRAFNDEGVKMLCWPPKSTDLNPIENI